MADTDYDLEDVLGTYRLDGSMSKAKSRVLHEQVLDVIYERIRDQTTPTNTIVDIAKHLAEVGDLRPKTNVQPQNQGPGFSISIVIPQTNGKEPIIIDAKPDVAPVEDEEEADGVLEQVCEGVMPIAVPDFDLSNIDDLDDLLEYDDNG
jgi:hypothetical protein